MADLQGELYSIAFGEIVPLWSDYDKEYNETVLALLTSIDDFPPLPTPPYSKNKSKARNKDNTKRRKSQEEWQIIYSQNCSFDNNNNNENNLSLVSILYDNIETDKISMNCSVSTASSWQHIDSLYTTLPTFSQIASKAGYDHTPIPKNQFFKHTKNVIWKQISSTKNNTRCRPFFRNHTSDENENSVYNHIYDTRSSERIQKSYYVNLRKQKLNKLLLHRRLRSLSSTVLKTQEQQGNVIGEDIRVIEAKKTKAIITNNCLSPKWSFYKPSHLLGYIYVPKGGFTVDYHCQSFLELGRYKPQKRRKTKCALIKKNLISPVKRNVTTLIPIWWDICQYGRQEFIKRMDYEGLLVPFPRNPRYRVQQEDYVKATQEVRQQVTRRINNKYPDISYWNNVWLGYGMMIRAVEDRENFTYHKQLAQLHRDVQRHVRTTTTILYNQLPRCYFPTGQRKYRKLNIRYFLQQLDNSSSGIQYSI
ncbi:hypothetical protein BDC45DRAFT_495854 [Circinella umbellata]|nr:hypothetical protein BDC45DRAFT_495854 [Circinella umbellata]